MNKKTQIALGLLAMCNFYNLDALANNNVNDAIVLSDLYVKPDYLEIENLKDTKEIIVIKKEDIEDKGYQSVSDVLKEVPSISVDTSGRGVIDIRGQGSDSAKRNIQVLIDGVPITNLTNHPFIQDYNLLPVNEIEKIEIIPGGGSVMYGAGATGGVINITTNLKNLKDSGKSIKVQHGTYKNEISGSISQRINDKTILSTSFEKTKEKFFFKDTYINKKYASLGISHNINKDANINLRYSHMEDEGKYIYNLNLNKLNTYGKNYKPKPSKITVGLDENGERIQKQISGYTLADRKMDSYNLSYNQKLNDKLYLDSDIFYNKGFFTDNNNEYKKMHFNNKGTRIKLDYKYKEGNNLLLGIDYLNQHANLNYNDYRTRNKITTEVPLSFLYNKKTYALYFVNKMEFNKWIFTQGLRREKTLWDFDKQDGRAEKTKDTRESMNTALELSFAYDYSDTGRFFGRYERGYNVPDGIQVSDSLVVDGEKMYRKTHADDEIYHNYELGLRDKIGISAVNLTLFMQNTDNELHRMYTKGFSDNQTINLVNTKRKGIDLSLSQRFGKLYLKEGYTYLTGKSRYSEAGLEFLKKMALEDKKIDWAKSGLAAVPKEKLNVKAEYEFDDKTKMGLNFTYFGKYNNFVNEKDNNAKNIMKGYTLVDLNFQHMLKDNVKLYFGVNNLTNKRYYKYAGKDMYTVYVGQGRNYYLGLNYRF